MAGRCIDLLKDVDDSEPELLRMGVVTAERECSIGPCRFRFEWYPSPCPAAALDLDHTCRFQPLLSDQHVVPPMKTLVLFTNACLMTLPAAALSRLTAAILASPDSAFLIFSKYCLTLDNSLKIGCSFALTLFSRRYAVTISDAMGESKIGTAYKTGGTR